MHYWGDDWFKEHGDDIYDAIKELNAGLRDIHILCLGKEKYGTYRTDFFQLWTGSWCNWQGMYNRYVDYSKNDWGTVFKKICYWTDDILADINRFIGLTWIIRKWQIKKINQLFQNVCKEHPDLIDELISDTDCYMYIKPGRYGDIDGEKIHNKYWKIIEK